MSQSFLPSVDDVLTAAHLIETYQRNDEAIGPLLFEATPEVLLAVVGLAAFAVGGLATTTDETPSSVLQQIRLLTTEAIAQLNQEETP